MTEMDFYTEKHTFPGLQSGQNYQQSSYLDHIFLAKKRNKYAFDFNFKCKINTSGFIKI